MAPIRIEPLLQRVERPARYLGDELNSVHKDPTGKLRVALCFPDLYEVGQSHLGVRILYHLLNELDSVVCERVYAPWLDLEALMRAEGIPLFTLESRTPVREMDLLGFSLPYEMLHSNVLNLLELASIPLDREARTEADPIVIAGGPACYNPAPIEPFIDVFVIGEAEESIVEVARAASDRSLSRRERIALIGRIPGCYLGGAVRAVHEPGGEIRELVDATGRPAVPVLKRVIADLDACYYPRRQVVPAIPIVHDRAQIELHRGCQWGCRFCQSGMIYRRKRERSLETLLAQAGDIVGSSGYEELGLTSLNSVDHTSIQELLDRLNQLFAGKNVAIGLPSLRMDTFSVELATSLQKVRKTQLTLAPEAGSQRLRDAINKNLTEDQILTTIRAALAAGWRDLKLYFMIGLPTETDDDLVETGRLLAEIRRVGREFRGGRPLSVSCSISPFVAKPHTPFQWERLSTRAELDHKIEVLRRAVPRGVATLKWRDFELAALEAVFSRGDDRLSNVLLEAHRLGCKFEGWTECFDAARWRSAFEAAGVDPAFYLRERGEDEVFPWETVSAGVTRSFLREEALRARSGETTPGCLAGPCAGCGVAGRGMGC